MFGLFFLYSLVVKSPTRIVGRLAGVDRYRRKRFALEAGAQAVDNVLLDT
jgi:hypothetical protein